MIRKTFLACWWAMNALLLLGIFAVGLHMASTTNETTLAADVTPPEPLPQIPIPKKREAGGTEMLRDLPNPLRLATPNGSNASKRSGRSDLSEIALLHGFDQVKGDLSSATAYLYLPSRKVQVNAYLGETIRDSATGEEIPELAGWKLAQLTSGGAVFRKGPSEAILKMGNPPWSGPGGSITDQALAAAGASPASLGAPPGTIPAQGASKPGNAVPFPGVNAPQGEQLKRRPSGQQGAKLGFMLGDLGAIQTEALRQDQK
ncbi:MAG: hypothetical protein HY716_06130 [Planctomycetes bacterium]|nr:hypothetical protein [Planctomycetota bacterium]